MPAGAAAERARNRRRTIWLVLFGLLVVTGLSLIGFGLVTHPNFTAVLRDISIIVLALVTVVIGLFLTILIFQLQSLTALLRDEIKPILESANDTANTVRGTTTFVSDAVVTPMIQVASVVAGVGQTLRVLTGSGRRRNRRPPSPPGPPLE
jgi:O-antigen/teichoic acid export membrane protein